VEDFQTTERQRHTILRLHHSVEAKAFAEVVEDSLEKAAGFATVAAQGSTNHLDS